jgi:hypothetical protein
MPTCFEHCCENKLETLNSAGISDIEGEGNALF